MNEILKPEVEVLELAERIIRHRQGGPEEITDYDKFMDTVGGPVIVRVV
jgi:hypothetical protein